MIKIDNLTLGYKKKDHVKEIIKELSFSLNKGELLCILGENGVGKTTLYKGILGLIKPLKGQILIDDVDNESLSSNKRGKLISYVPQYHVPPFPYKVLDVVLMARGAHISKISSPKKKDIEIAVNALETLNIKSLMNEDYTRISGGERQLVLIARALAQDTDYIFLDEPTSNLDFGNQLRVIKWLDSLSKKGKGVCFTSHNPRQALMFNTKVLILLKDHFIWGNANNIIDSKLISDMYGIDVRVRERNIETFLEGIR
ncbi:iron complex transport system ATP-binding protein [Acetitomaculum ruminis DSM 5522]|uniref:Iron complex transport system ATP-binding protein n=1 Tax=Acetitomaculum ruminis DSM 5522 TaxID=1120918 RepID=A0A1I0XA00_9FIRM|nr:ABC transporter ATP-binding protein [Acetitomaculum ruminis]SFA97862.1 iron complex transport system ATP-binding protein [Acetitomaculum ruminis DSM 5522]